MTYKELLEYNITSLNATTPAAIRTASDYLVGPKSNLATKGLALAGLAALFYAPRAARKAKYRAQSEISRFL